MKKGSPLAVVLVALFWATLGVAVGQPPPLQVAAFGFGAGIENRQLQGEGKSFPFGVGRVYAWTQIEGAAQPTTITHVWYVDEKKVAEVPLAVRYPRHRTWSAKKIWPGKWRVEILDAEGNLLHTGSFVVEK